MKKILAIFVAFIILVITSVVFQLTKVVTESSGLGQNLYNELGKIGIIIEVGITLLPLIIGIWLMKLSWKKITFIKSTENKNTSLT